MRLRLFVLLLFVVCVGWFEACGPDDACSDNAACKDGKVCQSGRCAAPEPSPPKDAATEPKPEQRSEASKEPEPREVAREKPPEPRPPEDDKNCSPGASRLCYSGDPQTRGIGDCVQGKQRCLLNRTWAACIGERVPTAEVCDGKDNDCDGTTDEESKCDACSECKEGKCVIKSDVSPILSSIDPDKIQPLSSLLVELKGSCIAEKAEVYFRGKLEKNFKYVDKTTMEVTLDLTGVTAGKYPLKICNPGDFCSKELSLEVLKPTCSGPRPSIRTINPASGEMGKKIGFSVQGFSFMQGSTILFDGKAIPTKFVSTADVQADPSLDLSNVKTGSYKVMISNPNGCDSNQVDFLVFDPNATPQITSITPTTITLDKSNSLTIVGTGFLPGIAFYIGLNGVVGLQYRSPTLLQVVFTPQSAAGWTTGQQKAYVINGNKKQSNTINVTLQK